MQAFVSLLEKLISGCGSRRIQDTNRRLPNDKNFENEEIEILLHIMHRIS